MTQLRTRDSFVVDTRDVDLDVALQSPEPCIRALAERAARALDDVREMLVLQGEISMLEERIRHARSRVDALGRAATPPGATAAREERSDRPGSSIGMVPAVVDPPSLASDSLPAARGAPVCPDCERRFAGAQGLASHRAAAHRKGTPDYACTECAHVSPTANGLGVHRARTHGIHPATTGSRTMSGASVSVGDIVNYKQRPPGESRGAGLIVGRRRATSASPGLAPEVPKLAMCGCGHAQRHHEDRLGICGFGSCACSTYAATSVA